MRDIDADHSYSLLGEFPDKSTGPTPELQRNGVWAEASRGDYVFNNLLHEGCRHTTGCVVVLGDAAEIDAGRWSPCWTRHTELAELVAASKALSLPSPYDRQVMECG